MKSYSAARRAPSRRFAISLLTLLLAGAAYAEPPDLTPISGQSVREGAFLSIPLAATDPDGDGVIFSASGLPFFCLLDDNLDGTGSIDCSPGASDAGNSNIMVTATDDSVLEESSSDNFVLTVEANTAPNIGNIGNESMAEGETLTIAASASDGDDDGLSFSSSGLPGFCSLTDNNDGTADIECNPLAGDADTYNPITITVTDDAPLPLTDSDQFSLTVTANTAPVLSPIDNQAVAEGASLNIPLSATDANGDDLTFSETGLPGFCSLTDSGNGTGNIACNPGPGDGGTYTPITITVTDDAPVPASDSDPFTLSVTANTAPVLTPIANQGVAEGSSLNIPLNATDPNGDGLSFSQSGLPGFCSLTDNGNGTGNIACNPTAGDGGGYPITITVTDNAPIPLNDSDNFTLSVSTNTPPVLIPIANQSVQEGDSLSIPLSATDGDGDGLTFSQTGLPGFCLLTDNGNGTGSIACNPLGGDGGTYPVTITVTDDAPVPSSDSDPFTLTVTANNPPVLTAIPDQSVVEGGSLNIGLSATDPDGDGMSFSQAGMPGFCSLTDNGNGTGSIGCNPAVGNAGAYPITVTVTDDGPVPAASSDLFVLTVDANQAPTASSVTISGDPTVNSVLTGNYVYADAEDDPEGTSTFRWLRGGVVIPGAVQRTYTVDVADVETALRFEVTPVASSGASPGTPVQSGDLVISNTAPSITGQNPIEVAEDTSREIVLADVIVSDLDSDFPDDFTLSVQNGANYTRSGANGNTITPVLDFNGDLSVPVTVNDGFVDSPVFNLVVTVTAVNDAPTITGLAGGAASLSTPEDQPLTISVADDLVISDPDNTFPTDFTLTLQPGENYTLFDPLQTPAASQVIIPAENFNGQLSVPATVSDLEPLSSAVFFITVDVTSVNDSPVGLPIDPQTAIEDALFQLDLFANFSDADGDELTFSATGLPDSNSITIDPVTGLVSGTPSIADARDNDPYEVVITATDPSGGFDSVPFELTVSALDRANLALSIDVTPENGLPNDQLVWTFETASNGPAGGENIELTGSFVGAALTVAATGGATCTINVQTGQVDFLCPVGELPAGGTQTVEFTTTASQATEVVAFGTTAGAQRVPIDPNTSDNSAIRAVGVAESFSDGAVQILGSSTIQSVASGDVNGDGRPDLVVGTSSGQSVQIYLGDEPRESCQCIRDFAIAPLTPIPDQSSHEGIALADFDNSGTLDLVLANGGGQADAVYSNDGTGNFTLMATLELSNGQDVAVGDFNGDGNMDIAIAANSPNPVYLGDGNGGFLAQPPLGDAESSAVAVGRFDGDALDDLVFANVGTDSRVWLSDGAGTFSPGELLQFGDAASVAASDLNADGLHDIVLGRVPSGPGDIPANPVLLNQGGGSFGEPFTELGISPTNEVLIGDVSDDGVPDIVFINASGLHQTWVADGAAYTLHSEQIIDLGAATGVLADLGFADTDDPGGVDLAIGGELLAGLGVYLNDSSGNLGLGDAVPPVISLNGNASVNVPAGTAYTDAGASATDNIDGDVSRNIVVNNPVNSAVVGAYTVTYNVQDFAGNDAVQVTRTVSVTAATGRGGGGGGTVSYWALALLVAAQLLVLSRTRRELQRRKIEKA
jgi:hypothetical protein